MKLNKTFKKILIIGVVLGAIVGSWAVWYVFFKPHRNVGNEAAAYTLTTAALSNAFKTDTAAMTKYIDQAILIEGPISAIEGSHISFDNIICNIDSTDIGNWPKGSQKTRFRSETGFWTLPWRCQSSLPDLNGEGFSSALRLRPSACARGER